VPAHRGLLQHLRDGCGSGVDTAVCGGIAHAKIPLPGKHAAGNTPALQRGTLVAVPRLAGCGARAAQGGTARPGTPAHTLSAGPSRPRPALPVSRPNCGSLTDVPVSPHPLPGDLARLAVPLTGRVVQVRA